MIDFDFLLCKCKQNWSQDDFGKIKNAILAYIIGMDKMDIELMQTSIRILEKIVMISKKTR